MLPKLILLALSGTAGIAQSNTPSGGAITGVVVDVDGKPIPEAQVYALPEDAFNRKPFETMTDTNGSFGIDHLPDNRYYLDASKEKEGYIYNLFSFYIMPGQSKPQVEVRQNESYPSAIIKLGAKVAYLNLAVVQGNKENGPVELTFTRPDLPGFYKRSYSSGETIAVPPVPFRFVVAAVNRQSSWSYRDKAGSDLLVFEAGPKNLHRSWTSIVHKITS